MTQKEAYYILVEGRFYKGDIEGKQYHWKKPTLMKRTKKQISYNISRINGKDTSIEKT